MQIIKTLSMAFSLFLVKKFRPVPTKHQPTKNAGITLFGLTDV